MQPVGVQAQQAKAIKKTKNKMHKSKKMRRLNATSKYNAHSVCNRKITYRVALFTLFSFYTRQPLQQAIILNLDIIKETDEV